MLTISAKADISQIRRLFPTADVQRTTMYQDYRRYPVIVVQFATRAEEECARALVAGKGAGDGKA